ncbi:MAG: hypothetical protein FJ098_08370, partial [Deltaproteobacteria bacterium]|nr:hypothetical protein [Deltaproteobacteria bacterium]
AVASSSHPRELQLTFWPDLGKPGERVTVEARAIPEDASLAELAFRCVADPCGGELVQDGVRAEYRIPRSCEGGRIIVEAALPLGDGEELVRNVSFRVEGLEDSSGSLMLWPQERAFLTSPVQVAWDRTFVRKERLDINLRIERRGETVVYLPGLDAESELELDLAASPEPTDVEMCAGGGTCQKVRVNVFRRRAIELPALALVVDDFAVPDANRLGGRRLAAGSPERVRFRPGRIWRPDGGDPVRYLAVEYHRSPEGVEQGLAETLGPDGQACPLAGHPVLSLWLRPGPLNKMPGPINVRLVSRSGEVWTRRVTHRGPYWEEHRVDVSRFVNRVGGAVRLELTVDETRAQVPAGTFHVGPLAFVTREVAEARAAREEPAGPLDAVPGDELIEPGSPPPAAEEDGSWSER